MKKLRILVVSDSPWAPTGFGTNTRCIASIFAAEGHTVAYAGCQNPKHEPNWETPWPLGQTEKKVSFELLPFMYPGQEKFGEKSFPQWIEQFKPDLVFTHLDIQMFAYMTDAKIPTGCNLPLVDEQGARLNMKQMQKLAKQAYRMSNKPRFKLGSIIPIDGQPSIPQWQSTLEHVDHPVAMAEYGRTVMEEDFASWKADITTIPHGVDCNFFKPKEVPKPNPDTFIIGCVARNQHRKNIPRLLRAFKLFVEQNDLTPEDAKLMLHMDWNDHMGWNIEYMTSEYVYDIREYLLPPTMGNLEQGENPDDEAMVGIYNLMDVHALPTGGEGFGIPTVEAMACGVPNVICNYTTSYELVGADKPECPPEMLKPHGEDGDTHLIQTNRGFLVPYKDLMWDTPIRAAPQRALWDEKEACKAFTTYYNNRDLLKEHSENARKYALKHYDWKVVGKKWLNWIKKVAR
jgi:glycosyltransferase involved in cell wall biosynthesis